jgi:Uma2 family endonuclease
MTTLAEPVTEIETVSDLLERLGDIPPSRVLMQPAPGTATVEDILRIRAKTGRLCELVNGTLVEKGMGYRESALAVAIAAALRAFVIPRNLGIVTGESGMVSLFTGLVRIPDVAYVSWDRIPGGKMPNEPVPHLAPNLAVEVLSPSNTPREMEKKRREYFKAGVELVWIVDPVLRTVEVYTSPTTPVNLLESDTLDGGDILPGFTLSLRELFAELDRVSPQ